MNAADSLLAVLMADNAGYWDVAELVTEADFPNPAHGRLFAAIAAGAKSGTLVDAVTLIDTPHGELAMDIAVNAIGFRANARAYAETLAKAGERHRVREAGQRIAVCGDYAEAQGLLAAARPLQAARLKSATDGLREMLDALQMRFEATGEVTGIPTGLESLDAITGGWQAGNLVGVGGETSSGKTTFAMQAAIAGGRCYYASLEMTAAELLERVVCNIGQLPHRFMRFPKESPEGWSDLLYAAVDRAKALPLVIDDQPGLTPEQICARARQLHMVEPLRLVVIDHLGLVKRPRKNDASELGEAAIAFKGLAKELGVPVLVLVQLNRANRTTGDRRPQLHDFRSSGEIEEALDVAVMVYRDEYHNPTGPLAGYAEFIVRKNRQGERNVTAWAHSYLSQMRFESCVAPAQEQPKQNNVRSFADSYRKASEF